MSFPGIECRGLAISALRRSPGSLCTTPPGTFAGCSWDHGSGQRAALSRPTKVRKDGTPSGVQ